MSSNSAPLSDTLELTLSRCFGFTEFRPGQQAVCQTLRDGRDVLVVMPTGSGKSLCYQLPAIARGGTALVISPLIALMEDQVAKLSERGIRAERIHSGRAREHSRAAAIAYRDGHLQFLFIAPERLSVPGFPEFLARRTPSLIAVDEAHCISQWGHDFRPDYRMLQQHLQRFRPAPVIALTATATPIVQNDIAQQLALKNPLRFIQGFRRKNIAVEVVEIAPSARRDAVVVILSEAAHRPAIIYVPTRGESNELAADLATRFRAQPYHAGLAASFRQQVQEQFLSGELDVIVATIAFGMGIDKPDVRTVIHTALPGSVEAYYQEIGRAGRDGSPSRALLMHSYADRRRHDFFFDRDYPEPDVLADLYKLLGHAALTRADLEKRSRLDGDLFEKALEKLWVHGGALIDPEENVAQGRADWLAGYQAVLQQREAQLEAMLRYAARGQCRMAALVRHFGDHTDSQSWCGLCDFCDPDACVVQQFREVTAGEQKLAQDILAALADGRARSTGKLFAELCGTDRDVFEELLAAMGREDLLSFTDATFEKDGKVIPYRTVQRTRTAADLDASLPLSLRLKTEAEKPHRTRSRRGRSAAPLKAKAAKPPQRDEADPLTRALRGWRLAEAKSKSLPAFRILTDQVLYRIAEDRPLDEDDLLAIPGIGPAFVKRYGEQILRLVLAA